MVGGQVARSDSGVRRDHAFSCDQLAEVLAGRHTTIPNSFYTVHVADELTERPSCLEEPMESFSHIGLNLSGLPVGAWDDENTGPPPGTPPTSQSLITAYHILTLTFF